MNLKFIIFKLIIFSIKNKFRVSLAHMFFEEVSIIDHVIQLFYYIN